VNTVINLIGQDIPQTVYAIFCCYIIERFTNMTEIVFMTLLQAEPIKFKSFKWKQCHIYFIHLLQETNHDWENFVWMGL